MIYFSHSLARHSTNILANDVCVTTSVAPANKRYSNIERITFTVFALCKQTSTTCEISQRSRTF